MNKTGIGQTMNHSKKRNILKNHTKPKPINNNNNTASPHQTDPGHVLARAFLIRQPSHVLDPSTTTTTRHFLIRQTLVMFWLEPIGSVHWSCDNEQASHWSINER